MLVQWKDIGMFGGCALSRAIGILRARCESFCRDYDKEKFHPHELHHNTVLDVAIIAQQLDVKNLVLYHTEDSMLSERKEHYIAEARRAYSGNIYVPNDLESIII